MFESALNEVKKIVAETKASNKFSWKTVACPAPNCKWSGNVLSSFRSHINRKHKQKSSTNNENLSPIAEPVETVQLLDLNNLEEFELEQKEDTLEIDFTDDFDISKDETANNSLFLNSLKYYSSNLTEKVYPFFNEVIRLRWQVTIPENVYLQISLGIYKATMKLFSETINQKKFEDLAKLCERFINSLYLQKVYLKSIMSVIIPKTISIGFVSYQYVPIKKIAALVLKNKSLVRQIIAEQSTTYGFKEYSGELTCDYSRWCRIRGKLRIQIYADGFGIVNPIGGSATEHKYVGVYCCFTNIPLKYRMKRCDRFLVLIAKYKHFSYENLQQLYQQLINDLSHLENNGIDITLSTGETLNIPCIVSTIVADNLEQYQLLGCSSNFGNEFICRVCAADKSEIQNLSLTKRFLGNSQDIAYYNNLVAQADGYSFPKNTFGLKRVSIFNSLPSFNGIWSHSPFDILHDTSEGVIPIFTVRIIEAVATSYGYTKAQMIKLINSYTFYDCTFSISDRKKGGYNLAGDAVQVYLSFMNSNVIFIIFLEN